MISGLLSQDVQSIKSGRRFKALIQLDENRYKCMLCEATVPNRMELSLHFKSNRHARYKTYYKDVESANAWGSRGRPPSPPGGPSGRGPHYRQRPNQGHKEQVEAPWTFSPSEAVREDDHNPGYADDYSNDHHEDYGDNDYRPPSAGDNRTPPYHGDASPVHSTSGRAGPTSGGGGGFTSGLLNLP